MSLPVLEAFQVSRLKRTSSSTSFVMDAPAGIVVGELLTLTIGSDSTVGGDWNGATGWVVQQQGGTETSDTAGVLLSRIADGTEGATVTVTAQSAHAYIGYYHRWSNVDTLKGIHGIDTLGAVQAWGTNDNVDVPAMTVAADDRMLVCQWSMDGQDGYPISAVAGSSGALWPQPGTFDDQETWSDLPDSSDDPAGVWGGFINREMQGKGLADELSLYTLQSDGWCAWQWSIAGFPPPANFYPVLEQSVVTKDNPTTASILMTVPAGIVAGELLTIMVWNDNLSSTPQFVDNVAGWNFHYNVGNSASDNHMGLYSRVADGNEGDVAIPQEDDGSRIFGFYQRWSNVDTTAGVDGIEVIGVARIVSTNALLVNELTLLTPQSLVVAVWGFDGGDGGLPWTVAVANDWPDTIPTGNTSGNSEGSTAGVSGGFLVQEKALVGLSTDLTIGSTGTDGTVTTSFTIAGAVTPGYPYQENDATTSTTSTSVSHAIALPSGIVAGDGLFMFLSPRDATTVTDWNGFTPLFEGSSSRAQFNCGYKEATGTEGSSVTIVTDVSTFMEAVVVRYEADTIHPWGTNPPEIEVTDQQTGSLDPDPPPNTPSWGSDLTGWIAGVVQSTQNFGGFPPYYTMIRNLQAPTAGDGITIMKRNWEAATEDPGVFQTFNTNNSFPFTLAVKPPAEPEWFGDVALGGVASIDFDGVYVPALFTGQFSLGAEAAIDPDGFFFEDQEGDLNLAGVAALTMTGETEPPVFNSWFSLGAEATLDIAGVAEVEGSVALGAEAAVSFKGSFVPAGGGVPVLAAEADLTFTGEYSPAQFAGAMPLGAEATITFTGEHTPPVFTGQFILGAVASISAQALFLPLLTGEFSLSVEADFGIWAQVPLQPGTGSSVKGDRATPARVWSLEDPTTVEGEDDPTRVKGRQ